MHRVGWVSGGLTLYNRCDDFDVEIAEGYRDDRLVASGPAMGRFGGLALNVM